MASPRKPTFCSNLKIVATKNINANSNDCKKKQGNAPVNSSHDAAVPCSNVQPNQVEEGKHGMQVEVKPRGGEIHEMCVLAESPAKNCRLSHAVSSSSEGNKDIIISDDDASTCLSNIDKEHVVKKPVVKLAKISERKKEAKILGDVKSLANQGCYLGGSPRGADVPKVSSSLSSLRLNLCNSEAVSSPECGSSPEIRYHSDRFNANLSDGSLTSTPLTRQGGQTFGGASYLTRRNLSRENAFEDSEDSHSYTSSDFSPGSTTSSVGAERFNWPSKGYSDLSSEGRYKRGIDLSDEGDVHLPLTPVNKQLRIVTSVDRALYPHRRSSFSSLKHERGVLNVGRSSSENLEHLAFVDFLKRLKLGNFLKHFPPNMTLLDFKLTTDDELSEVYGVHDPEARRCLMAAIEFAKEEEGSDNDSLRVYEESIFPEDN